MFDAGLKEAERQVNAVNGMRLSATNDSGCPAVGLDDARSLHRDLVRGTGFFKSLVEDNLAAQFRESAPWNLPTVDFLAINDIAYRSALLDSLLPQDRQRFECYLEKRPLGVGMISAVSLPTCSRLDIKTNVSKPAGFGKTTYCSVATLALATSQGLTYGSAPTHVAVSNMAERVERIDLDVATAACKYDDLLDVPDTTPTPSPAADPDTSALPVDEIGRRRKLIIRGFPLDDEVHAILLLLENPELTGDMVELHQRLGNSRWHLAQSLTFSFFLALGHVRVVGREIRSSDPIKVHNFKQLIDAMTDLSPLRELASGKLGWDEYTSQQGVSKKMIKSTLSRLLNDADLVFTTPARSESDDYCDIKKSARAIVLDEAASMHRADYFCVHGNTLVPVLLVGDPKQLPPFVAACSRTDTAGNALNRHVDDGLLASLDFLASSGLPVARLKQQLRMADGLFDLAAKLFYPDLDFTYGEQSDIGLPKHEPGRLLEQFVQGRFPNLRPPPTGKLQPVFLHCPGHVSMNPMTRSKRNVEQSLYALDFLVDFIAATGIDASNILILTPYIFNLQFLNRKLRRPQYASLKGAGEASTVDSFQGREGAIVIYVTVSNRPSGPGFIANERRLNVAITRQVSGLIIVGDINLTGNIVDEKGRLLGNDNGNGKGKGKGKGKGHKPKPVLTHHANGKAVYKKCDRLRELVTILAESGRVALPEAVARQEKREEEEEN